MWFRRARPKLEAQRRLLALQRDLAGRARSPSNRSSTELRNEPRSTQPDRRAGPRLVGGWSLSARPPQLDVPAGRRACGRCLVRRAQRCCTGTTRWCRARSSTSPASRRSWTCSCSRSMPTGGRCGRDDQPAGAAAEPRHPQRRGEARRDGETRSFDAVGAVQFDERLSVVVQTRSAGYLERLAVRAHAARRQGQVLATVFARVAGRAQRDRRAAARRRRARAAGRGASARAVDPARAAAPGRGGGVAQARATRCSRRPPA